MFQNTEIMVKTYDNLAFRKKKSVLTSTKHIFFVLISDKLYSFKFFLTQDKINKILRTGILILKQREATIRSVASFIVY